MKRFIKEYAADIEKEINRRISAINDPHKLTVYSMEKTGDASERLKNLMFYAENCAIVESEIMLELAKIDPRNVGRF